MNQILLFSCMFALNCSAVVPILGLVLFIIYDIAEWFDSAFMKMVMLLFGVFIILCVGTIPILFYWKVI